MGEVVAVSRDEARVAARQTERARAQEMGDEIARMAANIDAATHRLLFCIRQFDESEEWGTQGALSCAHWLMWRVGWDAVTAREKVRVARALGGLPLMSGALGRGEVSYSKVRAMTRVATPENEERLLEMSRYMSGAQLEKLVRKVHLVKNDSDRRDKLDDHRTVSETILSSGMARITLVLHPDEADLVLKAIQKAREEAPLVPAEDRECSAGEMARDSAEAPAAKGGAAQDERAPAETAAPQAKHASAGTSGAGARPPKMRMISRADAMMKVAASFLAHGEAPSNGGERYQVLVHLEQDPFGVDGSLAACLDDGTRVSAETFKRVTCDCGILPVVEGEKGDILNLGRRRRTISPALRRALQARDGGCRFPGCTNRLFVSGHHSKHWIQGGETSKQNCCLLCDAHHHLLHEGCFTMEGDPDGELVFRNRHGLEVKNVPEPEGGSAWSLLDDNRRAGLNIDEETSFPQWDGEPIQWDACIHGALMEH